MKLSKKCNVYGGQVAGQFVYCARPRDHDGPHGATAGDELVTWDGDLRDATRAVRAPWWRRALRWMVRA